MSWAALIARGASLFLLLPLALRAFAPETVTVWLALVAIATILGMCDLGFGPTLTRLVAYALRETDSGTQESYASADWQTLSQIAETLRPLYLLLALAGLVFGGAIGSWYLSTLILNMEDPADGWIAWLVLLASYGLACFGARFTVFLSGLHRIAFVRRWEAIGVLVGTISGCAILLCDGGLAALMLATQIWPLVSLLAVAKEFRKTTGPHVARMRWKLHASIIKRAWPAAWRSQIGMLAGVSAIHFAGLAYARLASAEEAASMLVALRLMSALSQFSQPPFYTRLPALATMYQVNSIERLLSIAKIGLTGSCWTFVVGAIVGGPIFREIFALTGSQTPLVSQPVWALLAVGFYLERVGSMHLQLSAVSNQINWHISNTVNAAILALCIAIAYPVLGIYTVAAAMTLAYGGFLTVYAIVESRRHFRFSVAHFEFQSTVVPGLVLIGGLCLSFAAAFA